MTAMTTRAPFRLAFRKEGRFVHAYLASTKSMEGAELLCSVRLGLLGAAPDHWDRWRDLVTELFKVFVEERLRMPVELPGPEPAPEHERAGEA